MSPDTRFLNGVDTFLCEVHDYYPYFHIDEMGMKVQKCMNSLISNFGPDEEDPDYRLFLLAAIMFSIYESPLLAEARQEVQS